MAVLALIRSTVTNVSVNYPSRVSIAKRNWTLVLQIDVVIMQDAHPVRIIWILLVLVVGDIQDDFVNKMWTNVKYQHPAEMELLARTRMGRIIVFVLVAMKDGIVPSIPMTVLHVS